MDANGRRTVCFANLDGEDIAVGTVRQGKDEPSLREHPNHNRLAPRLFRGYPSTWAQAMRIWITLVQSPEW